MVTAASIPTPALAAGPAAVGRVVDLTHVLTDGFSGSPLVPSPRRVPLARADTPPGIYNNQWTLTEHSGTHVDMPAHFVANGRTVDDIPLDQLIMPAVVVDIAARAAAEPDAAVGVSDLRDFEATVGRIPAGAAVLAYSGWESRIGGGGGSRDIEPDGHLHFPGWSVEAADWLLMNRDVRCLGVDTPSLDPGNSLDFPVHRLVLPADRLGVEILANLKQLPPIGALLVLGVVPFEKGSGAPGRIFAII